MNVAPDSAMTPLARRLGNDVTGYRPGADKSGWQVTSHAAGLPVHTAALAAAVAVVLHRYTLRDEVAVPVSDGSGPRWVVLRTEGDPTYAELVAAAAGEASPEIVGRVPLAVVMPGAMVPDADLTVSGTPDGIEVRWNTGSYDPGAAERIAGQVVATLRSGAALPDAPIGRLQVGAVNEDEAWAAGRGPAVEIPDLRLPETVSRRARCSPDAPAVVSATTIWSYAELDRRVNQIANRLVSGGVRQGDIVAVSLPRGLDLPAAALATMRSGGVYLPIDANYPDEWIRFALRDAGAHHLLSIDAVAERLLPLFEGPVTPVVLEAGPGGIDAADDSDPGVGVAADDLAYLIYTSGSTGRPKGVEVEHRGLVNLGLAMTDVLGLGQDTRELQFASPSFDAFIFELACAFCSGGALVVAPEERLQPGGPLHATLQELDVTMATLPPSALAVLIDLPLPALQVLLTAGESSSADLVSRWATGRKLFNAYGPTEATVCASVGRASESDREPAIGRPLRNVSVHLLDDELQPVGEGMVGELCIGGVGVARGYHGRPELTARQFVTLPTGERVYRSNDLARRRDDGSIEFMGRRDNQVKVRGFRVELDEVEAVLARHPAVRHAVATVRPDAHGSASLVAHVTTTAEVAPLILRRHVAAALPPYMVPNAVVIIDRFPTTPNGKVDRKSLPAPTRESTGGSTPYVAPAAGLPAEIADIFSAVLGVDRVGADDDFWELGGHSLAAGRAVVRLREEHGVELRLADLQEHRSVAALAGLLQQRAAEAPPRVGSSPLAGRRRVVNGLDLPTAAGPAGSTGHGNDEGDPAPLSFGQQRLWFLDQLHPGDPTYNTAVAQRLRGPLDVKALRRAMALLVSRHQPLRQVFRLVGDEPAAFLLPTPADSDERLLSVIDAGPVSDEELQRILTAQIRRPFDLAADMPLRPVLIRRAAEDHVLLFATHHIACDGWSKAILWGELSQAYTAALTGTDPALPPLPVTYSDYAIWQRSRMQGEFLESELAYWRSALADAPTRLELPVDRPRPATQGFEGEHLWFDLPAETTALVKRTAGQERVTFYMLTLAAFGVLLHRLAGTDDVLIGSPAANRQHSRFEPLVGFFVNTLPMRVRADGAPTFRQLLDRVRDTALDALVHQEVPFERIVEAVGPPRDTSRNPLVQVNFRAQTGPAPTLSLPGVTATDVDVDVRVSRFDLAIEVQFVGDQARGYVEYNTALFEPASARRIGNDYAALLQEFCSRPDRPAAAAGAPARRSSRRLGAAAR